MRAAKLKFYSLIASLVLIWCGNFIALKICLKEMSALGVTAFRVTSAALILLIIYRFSRRIHPLHKLRMHDYVLLFKVAFMGLFLNQLLFINGLKYTTVAHSAVIVTFGPLFTLLFAWMRGEEKLTKKKVYGMLLSIVGITVLNMDRNLRLQTEHLLGDFLTLCGSIAFSYYTVLSKNAASLYGSISSTAFTYFAGACLFLPFGLPSILQVRWLAISWVSSLSFMYVALLASVLAPLIFYYALRRMSASAMASLTYLQPVVTTISSALILSEKLSLNFIVGGSIVLSGLLLTQRPGSR